MKRGDVCWCVFKLPDKRRPVLILTRDSAISILSSVTVAPITSKIRDIPTQIVLTAEDGLPKICAANFDNLQTIPKSNVGARIAHLSSEKMLEAATAMNFALGMQTDV